MDKRTLLAIVLSIIVIAVWSYFIAPQPQVPMQAQAPLQGVEQEVKTAERLESPAPSEIPAPLAEDPSDEKEIFVETDVYSAVITTKGGTIKKWLLKDYIDKELNPVSLVSADGIIPPITIILEGKPADFSSNINFSTDKDSIILRGPRMSDTLTFYHTDPSGISIKKTFTFYRDSYKVGLVTEVKGAGTYRVALGSDFGLFDKEGTWVHIGPVLLNGTDKEDIKGDNIEGIGFISRLLGRESKDIVEHKGDIYWIAQEDKYFTASLASLNHDNNAVVWAHKKPGGDKTNGAEIAFEVTQGKGEFLLYAGPKKSDILKPLGVGLEHIVDYGFFSIIAKPLFWLLEILYKVLGNYGWAIILITIVVRIPFIPLINKGQRSMKKMQAVQPHMAAIKEKYAKDPQRMQKETMELYKKHKVNPVGGCLPMLIQLPVFFALYKILLIAIELRDAPFIFWITDLSAKDPYYILPVVMGISMVIQQKMTPSGMDPKQAKMMMLMPVVMIFLFLNFPSGLVLYWLVSNTLGIVQQYFVNKKTSKSSA